MRGCRHAVRDVRGQRFVNKESIVHALTRLFRPKIADVQLQRSYFLSSYRFDPFGETSALRTARGVRNDLGIC